MTYLRFRWLLPALLGVALTARGAATGFSFEPEAQPGFVAVGHDEMYDPARGYGFVPLPAGAAAGPVLFAVSVPEGNYDVTMRFGDRSAATSTTVRAASRRLMIERVDTTPGQFETRRFTINVRRPAISGGGAVELTAREKGPPIVPDWDDHLTFEFNGSRPGVASLEIKLAASAITLYLAGDSTVTDQPTEPWTSWGQMLPAFFGPGVAVANHAESGLALFSFEHQRRLDKILSTMKPGDYLFIQFGHNDQKDKSPGAGPYTTYQANLRRFVEAARAKGGIPVIVTPMERRRWAGGQPQPTLADFAEAARQVAAEEKTPLIDLNAMSLKFYTALGPDGSTRAFVHYPAHTFPGQNAELKDDTHHNAYGAYELARCVVEGIKAGVPALTGYLRNPAASFDPSHPDSPDSLHIPASPIAAAPPQKPAGS